MSQEGGNANCADTQFATSFLSFCQKCTSRGPGVGLSFGRAAKTHRAEQAVARGCSRDISKLAATGRGSQSFSDSRVGADYSYLQHYTQAASLFRGCFLEVRNIARFYVRSSQCYRPAARYIVRTKQQYFVPGTTLFFYVQTHISTLKRRELQHQYQGSMNPPEKKSAKLFVVVLLCYYCSTVVLTVQRLPCLLL